MQKKLKAIINHQFIQGSFLFTISNFIISSLNYLFNFLSGRSLGPNGYGEIVAFFSYLALFSIPLTIVSSLIIQKIGSNNANRFSLAKSLEFWILSKIKRWWFLLIFLVLLAPFLPQITNLSPLTSYLLILTIAISILSIFYSSNLQGLRIFHIISAVSIVTAIIKFSGAFLASLNLGNLTTVLILIIVSNIFNFGASFFFFKNITQNIKIKEKVEKRIVNILLSPYFFLASVSIISITLLGNLDIVFAKKFFSAKDAGLFSAWSLFAKIIFYLASPLITLSFVFFSDKKNAEEQEKILLGTLFSLLFIGIGCYLVYAFFPIVIEIIFGNKFKLIADFLPLAAFFGIFYTIISLFNNYFLAKKSLLTFILPLASPIYITLLLIYHHDIATIIRVDIFFGFIVSLIFLIGYFLQKKFNRLFIISS